MSSLGKVANSSANIRAEFHSIGRKEKKINKIVSFIGKKVSDRFSDAEKSLEQWQRSAIGLL